MSRLSIALLVIALLLTGCSSNGNPVLTDSQTNDDIHTSILPVIDISSYKGVTSATGILGAYDLILNPDDFTANLVAKRSNAIGESYIVDGLAFFTVSPCANCFKIKSVGLDSDMNVVITFYIKHPFPKGDPLKPPTAMNRLDLDIFDTALVIHPLNVTPTNYPLIGRSIYENICIGVDGYTTELSAVTDDMSAMPYYLVIDDSDSGASTWNKFEMGSEKTFTAKFKLSSTLLKFELYLTMGYGASAIRASRLQPKYYNPEFNRKAAWKVEVFPPSPAEVGSTWDNYDSTTLYNVKVHVYDWQQDATVYPDPIDFRNAPSDNIYSASNVASVSVEIPGMTNEAKSSTTTFSGTGAPDSPLVYLIPIANENLLPVGEYKGLVKVTDERTPSQNWQDDKRDYLISTNDGIKLDNYLMTEYATYQTFVATVVDNTPVLTTGNLMWAKRAGGASDDTGAAITRLSDNSIVITGDFLGTATFGQGEPNQTSLTSAGSQDIFVARYNSDGMLIWAKRAGGPSQDWGVGITALSDDSVVVTGFIRETAIFGQGEPNQTSLVSDGWTDIFLARYNSNGTLAWAKRAGSSTHDYGEKVATLSDDSIIATGAFQLSCTFGPGEPNQTVLTSAGDRDIYVARYNPNGTLAWAKRAGGLSYDHGYSICSLSDNSATVTGFFSSSATFGPSEPNQTVLTSVGGVDIFIARYNANGNLNWAKRAGGTQDDLANSIISLSDNSSVLTGYFEGTAIFGQGEPNETQFVTIGGRDIYVARYNPTGTLAWVKRAGGTQVDTGYGITRLSDDSVVTTGCFSVSSVFGQGEPNQTTLVSAGQEDIFIARFNSNGNLTWAKRAGGTARDFGRGIISLSDNSTVAVGTFGTQAVFGPGELNQVTLITAGGFDIFIARFQP